ncbi:MAG: extracellular solute-binding protein [Oscillospiraceae bacterium]|nr:extracellular solute-binding protein [Oscillospiraceae bacterium]
MKKANRILTIIMFAFLYLPMAVLIVASFNTGSDITEFEGFTFQQYVRLFQDDALLGLLGNSLIISILASAVATTFGTVAAVGIHNLKPKLRKVVMSLTNIPMTNPDIVTGVSLSLLFVFVGSKMLGQKESLTFWTLLIAHITFNLPYVILNVMPKLQQMDSSLTDAAMDLGCTPIEAFFKVTLHEIMPGIVSGAIMAFTMSLDDFVISYFVTGTDFITLPVDIYSKVKRPIEPKIYAMFTLLFGLIFILMLTMNLMQLRSDKQKHVVRTRSESKTVKIIKRVAASVCIVAILFGLIFGLGFGRREETITLNVYNWGQYISTGEDDSLDVIAAFQEKYPHIKVNYSTYSDNETMYTKLKNGGITVDVIIPSDYMIARLIEEDMLLEIDFSNVPNYEYVDESFKNTTYDPENRYSVPYTWGTVGILYNSKYVDEADVTGWELMWNEEYTGKILMFGNSRDAFGITQYLLGYDVNTTDVDELNACADKLAAQKPILQQYVMDEIFAAMENEEAWIASYYAGDCVTMIDNNPNLKFYFPEHQGFNMFIDAMCIPTCAQEKEAAELFINFLCDPEISGQNLGYLGYSTPITAAKDYMDPEMAESELAYPSEDVLKNATSYAYLPESVSMLVEALFQEATKLIN